MTIPTRSATRRSRCAIGLDIGGTKIAGGVVDDSGGILHRLSIPSPADQDADATVAALLGLVRQLLAEHPGAEAVGVGAAGMVEWPAGFIHFAPNNAYRDLPLRAVLAGRTGLPTTVDNDANAAAWAEVCFGRGAGRRNAVVLTVGTGIGGGIVVDGRLLRGNTGIGAEVGHLVLNPEGRNRCGCGAVGCLEAEASGTALRRLGREAASADPEGALAALAMRGAEVTGEAVHRAAERGDPVAVSLFDRVGYWLGVGIASLVNIFEPEVVAVGGGLAATGEHLFHPARAAYKRFAMGGSRRRLPPVVPAALGVEAGIIGAAALAMGLTPPRRV